MPSNERTPYAVHCAGIDPGEGFGSCTIGLVYLTEEEYNQQMNAPNRTWRCPKCGGDAYWSDSNFESYFESENGGAE